MAVNWAAMESAGESCSVDKRNLRAWRMRSS